MPKNAFKFKKNGIEIFNTTHPYYADKVNESDLKDFSKSNDNTRKKERKIIQEKNPNNDDFKNTENITEKLTLKRDEILQENGKIFETKFSDDEVFVFGNIKCKALLPDPLWSEAKSKINEKNRKEKGSIETLKVERKENQNTMLPFVTDSMEETPRTENSSTNFIFDQMFKTHSNSSLLKNNSTNQIVQNQENITFVRDNNENKKSHFPSSSAVSATSTSQKSYLVDDFVFSIPKNVSIFNQNGTEIASLKCICNTEKIREGTLNDSLQYFGNPWKQTILSAFDGNLNETDSKISANLTGNLTLETHGTLKEKGKLFEKNFSENQSSLQLNALQELGVTENVLKNKSDGICMDGNIQKYSLDKERNNEFSHSYVQEETQVLSTTPEWYRNDGECYFNTRNKNLEFCVAHDSCVLPPFSDKISSAFSFPKSSNEQISGSFCDEIISNEKIRWPETISLFSADMVAKKNSPPDVDVNRAKSEIKGDVNENDRKGLAKSRKNRVFSDRNIIQQKEDKQIINEYEHPVFVYSLACDNNENKFSVGKMCNYVRSPHNDSFRNDYCKTRRRISFSDKKEEDVNDKSIGFRNEINSPRETVLRTGYFLSVRKTKHFCLPKKHENTPTVDKQQLHHNPSSHNQESNECWFRKGSENHSLAEKFFIEKPKQEKGKAALKTKLIFSENESEEFRQEDSCLSNQNVKGTPRKQDIPSKVKERFFIETDMQHGSESKSLTFSVKNCPAQISVTDNGNLRLETESPDNEEIYWIRNSGSSLNEDVLSSSLPAGSSDDENFHFHESTETSSEDEFTSECCSKPRNPERMISTSLSSCVSETYQTKSESNVSATSDIEKTENNAAVWKTSIDSASGNVREFAGNVEQNEHGIDDYLIRAESIMQNNVNLRNSKSKSYHLKYGTINLRFCDGTTNHVTIRLISENECPQTGSHSKKGENSEHYLTIKELKPTGLDIESSSSDLDSDNDSSIDVASTSVESVAGQKGKNGKEATLLRMRKNKIIDTETIKFDFIPDKGISEVKFRHMPNVTHLQYKSEKTKLYFKKKHF